MTVSVTVTVTVTVAAPAARSQSKLFVSELEDGVRAVERYVSALDREIQQRAELIEQLERSEIFYETQRTDAKVVAVVRADTRWTSD